MDERLIHSKSHALHNETKFRHYYVCEVIGYVRSWMIHISLNKKGRPGCNIESPRCSAKSSIAQDKFQPNPGLISCAGVTRRWGLLSNVMVLSIVSHTLCRERKGLVTLQRVWLALSVQRWRAEVVEHGLTLLIKMAEVITNWFSHLNRPVLSAFTEVRPSFQIKIHSWGQSYKKLKKLSTLQYPRSISDDLSRFN